MLLPDKETIFSHDFLELSKNAFIEKRKKTDSNFVNSAKVGAYGALPLIPFEICGRSCNHKAGPDSHIRFEKGRYPVPGGYLNPYADAGYSSAAVYIYSSHKLTAEHKRLPPGLKNGKGTEAPHLPYPVYIPETAEPAGAKAEETGTDTASAACRIYENAEIREQALTDTGSVPDAAGIYGEKILEEACRRALKDFHMVTCSTLIPCIKDISENRKNKMKTGNKKEQKHGTVRGADYYKKEGAE